MDIKPEHVGKFWNREQFWGQNLGYNLHNKRKNVEKLFSETLLLIVARWAKQPLNWSRKLQFSANPLGQFAENRPAVSMT